MLTGRRARKDAEVSLQFIRLAQLSLIAGAIPAFLGSMNAAVIAMCIAAAMLAIGLLCSFFGK